MKYRLVDFKDLVGKWYNQFLPEAAADKAMFVKDANIVYLNSVQIHRKRNESVKFMVEGIKSMCQNGTTTIFVQEPKAVNNIRFSDFFSTVERSSIAECSKSRILHIGNMRYIATSPDIFISQDKEMDDFLDGVWRVLSKLKLPNARFYSSSSVCVKEMCDILSSTLFPSNSLFTESRNSEWGSIKVSTSSEALLPIFPHIMKGKSENPAILRFISNLKQSLMDDFEQIV